MRRRPFALLAASLVVGATFVVTGAGPTGAATTTPVNACGVAPGASWRVTATAPCQVTIQVGTAMPLSLSRSYRWSALRSSSPAVTVSSTHPARGGLTGVVRAVSVGSAVVRSTGAIVCAPGRACPDLDFLWQMRVSVVASVASPQDVTVTAANANSTTTLRVGDWLVVNLGGPTAYRWGVPVAGDATVLSRQGAGPGQATFLAVGPGSTTVSVAGNPSCYPKCLMPSRIVSFHVTVTP
ncbi:MAG: hypothetical protein ACHQFZ_11025 [Acidimicrobiales bacterium]